jgi:CRISPR-associated protein Cmr4
MDSNYSIMTMYAVTPCHAGSGSALGTVDLPIQRERHTNWPVIQSSGMKGSLRANFDRYKKVKLDEAQLAQFTELTDNIFGDSKSAGSTYAGAISVSDAKILAFPCEAAPRLLCGSPVRQC